MWQSAGCGEAAGSESLPHDDALICWRDERLVAVASGSRQPEREERPDRSPSTVRDPEHVLHEASLRRLLLFGVRREADGSLHRVAASLRVKLCEMCTHLPGGVYHRVEELVPRKRGSSLCDHREKRARGPESRIVSVVEPVKSA